jgi:N-acetylglucosamine kinase-like BadF-type ATPase
MHQYFLGIDGGQTATVALIGDEAGRVVGVGDAGPCTDVKAAVNGSVAAACRAAGLAVDHCFAAAYLGLSGGTEGREPLVRQVLQTQQLQLTHDAAIALDGALAGEPGIVVIAGTGSIAYGRDATGKTVRVGGWGYVFGDEGGAFDITRQALRAALRHEEGWGPRTALGPILLEASGADSMNQLMHWAYTVEFPKQRLAEWATLVDQAAASGDALAMEILRGAGQQLAMIATAARRQLNGDMLPVSYTGGVFQSARVLETFQTFAALDGTMEVMSPRHSPAAGALIGAYRLAAKSVAITGAPASKK